MATDANTRGNVAVEMVALEDILPYENNPRDNTAAIDAVPAADT